MWGRALVLDAAELRSFVVLRAELLVRVQLGRVRADTLGHVKGFVQLTRNIIRHLPIQRRHLVVVSHVTGFRWLRRSFNVLIVGAVVR